MKTTVIIIKRGKGYVRTARNQFGGGHQGDRCGLTPYDAAARAAELMLQHAATNPEGGILMAPDEVKALVPEHLHEIAGNGQPS